MQPQIQIVQNVPLLPLGTTVLGSPAPGGRPTLVVDTTQGAMSQQGLSEFQLPSTGMPVNRSNQGSAMNRNRTRRAARPNNGPGVFNQIQQQQPQQPDRPSPSARITVQKLG